MPIVRQDEVYIPIKFVSDYLKVECTEYEKNSFILTETNFSLFNVIKFLPQDILAAFSNEEFPYRSQIINAVQLPSSLGIDLPYIDSNRMINTRIVTKSCDKEMFKYFNYEPTEEEKKNFASQGFLSITASLEDFHTIEDSKLLTEESIQRAKSLYPELTKKDLSTWTNGDFKDYFVKVDAENLGERFSDEQKKQLSKRKIEIRDTFYLFKEYHQIDYFLALPDAKLKEVIQSYYQLYYDYVKYLAETYETKE